MRSREEKFDLGDAQKLLAKDGPLGGVDGLVSKLNDAGLGDKVQSWIAQARTG